MVWAHDASMADEQLHNQQLFLELKKRFPEVPDNVVGVLMRDNHFVRERCIDALGRESNKYLYGPGDNDVLTKGLDNLHIQSTPERQVSSTSSGSGGGGEATRNRSESVDITGTVLGGGGRNCVQQPNNASGSATTTPNSDIDVHALYNPPLYGGGPSSQNGPYSARPYNYPPQTGQPYQHGAPPYTPQSSQASGSSPAVTSQGHYHSGWPYDNRSNAHPRHQTPTPPPPTQRFPQGSGIRTPSPQHYPIYPFDYPLNPYQSPGSPNTSRTMYYVPSGPGMDLPNPRPPNYPSSLPYMPVTPPTSTTTQAGGNATSPSGSTAGMWYLPSGSNAGTPTHQFPVYPVSGAWYQPESDQSHMVGVSNGPLDNRRGSEDSGYTQALLNHQRARMDKLRHDLESGFLALSRLADEVSNLEKETFERKSQRSSTFPTGEDVAKMRDENRRLLIDIQLMTREIDVVNNGQTPLGVIDPQEQNFYKNIGSTGQRGSIHAGGDDGSDRSTQPPHNTGERGPPTRPPPPTSIPVVPTPVEAPAPSQPDPEEAPNWSCSACTFLNHPLLDRCECCEMPRINTSNPAYR